VFDYCRGLSTYVQLYARLLFQPLGFDVCLGVGSQTSMEALYLMLFFVMLGMVVFGTVIFYCEAGTLDPQTGA